MIMVDANGNTVESVFALENRLRPGVPHPRRRPQAVRHAGMGPRPELPPDHRGTVDRRLPQGHPMNGRPGISPNLARLAYALAFVAYLAFVLIVSKGDVR